MHNEKRATRFSSGALILVIVLIVYLIIYPLIIAIVSVYFQSELDKLKFYHMQLKTALSKVDAREPSRRDRCICNTGNAEGQGHVAGNNIDDTMTGSLLSCCAADQETLELLIEEVYAEERKRNRHRILRERHHLSLGQIERYVESLLKRNRAPTQKSSDVGWRSATIPFATHVTGTTACFNSSEPIDGMLKVGRWSSMNGYSFNENISIDGYHMVVPKDGTYNVYSQAVFEYQGTEDDTDFYEYLHYTVLNSTIYSFKNIDLMKSVDIGENVGTRVTSFHSGLFKLKEGDKIYMKVYLPSSEVSLDCLQESTFMGMYLVSPEIYV
ncbi:uncharacterized protein [Ptychodera flava]|uniref:uncharacterized protein n=1 Tax=Ptychodera flava TaxID=63121 RepID=UPI00396A1AED